MGIRVKKVLGYGLTDLKTVNTEIVDERINREGWLFDEDKYCTSCKYTFDGFKKFCKGYRNTGERQETIFDLTEFHQRWLLGDLERFFPKLLDFADCVIDDFEYGLPNILLVCPFPDNKDWRRSDNTLDWIEESYCKNDSQQDWYKIIPHGIYPYIARYFDRRTGKLIDSDKFLILSRMINGDLTKASSEQLDEGNELAKKFFDESLLDFWPNIICTPPELVTMLYRYLEIFKSEESLKDLVPMLYTYWS